MDKKEGSKLRMRKMRNKSVTSEEESVTNVTPDQENVTQDVTDIPDYLMPLVTALSDINRRAKLRAICVSLSNKGLLNSVRYGSKGATMETCSELLEAF